MDWSRVCDVGGVRAVLGERRVGGVKRPVGERAKRGLFRKKWEVDMGAGVTPPSVGIVFGAEVLMHVSFWLPKMSESDGALHD